MKKLVVIVSLFFYAFAIHAQVNKSQSGNYKVRKSSTHSYASMYQNGYVILTDGNRLDGKISIIGNSYDDLYGVNLKGEDTYRFMLRSLLEFGLSDNLINDTPSKFQWKTLGKVNLMNPNAAPQASNIRKGTTDFGYVVTKSGETLNGYLVVKEVKQKVVQIELKTFDKKKYKFDSDELSNFGVVDVSRGTDEEENKKEDLEDAKLLDFEEKESEELGAYNPLDESFLATKTTDETIKNNGYVITQSGEKIEGAIRISSPPKIWFVTDVTLTTPDGIVTDYSQDKTIEKFVLTVNGTEKEFLNFENEYVEVLHRERDVIHFRNPHPTTTSNTGNLVNSLTGALIESADKAIRKEVLKKRVEHQIKNDRMDVHSAYSISRRADNIKNSTGYGDIDWTSKEVIKLYAKEFIVLNEKTERYMMYIPAKDYKQIEGELMGSIEYLKLDNATKNKYRKMSRPLETMRFLNNTIYYK